MALLNKLTIFFLQFLFFIVNSDTPANCMVDEVYGTWYFHLGKQQKTLNCTEEWDDKDVERVFKINLSQPNIATILEPENEQTGTWTMIYNQGFEVNVGLHSYFAFFQWSGNLPYLADGPKYNCQITMPGWTNDLLGNDFRCFLAVSDSYDPNGSKDQVAERYDGNDNVITMSQPRRSKLRQMAQISKNLERPFRVDTEFMNRLNLVPNSIKTWEHSVYANIWNNSMTIKQAKIMQGPFIKPMPLVDRAKNIEPEQENMFMSSFNAKVDQIPDSFDWRDVNGVNYVSPVRHQDMCGSCYIFASAAEIEARIRIATNNKKQPVLSTQQVVDCSPYGQGCEGGFPYLIAGRWAKDFGFVDEECYKYEGADNTCRDPELKKFMPSDEDKFGKDIKFFKKSSKTECFKKRYYTAMYKYVGGYFGNCNEESMKTEIFRHGPVSVGFEVLDDFRYYKSGIYQHTGLTSKLNEFSRDLELTNHAVLIVGYGHCDVENLDYWIVKNSWGEQWGENGYFRIVRGRDEVAIESMAQGSWVIPPL